LAYVQLQLAQHYKKALSQSVLQVLIPPGLSSTAQCMTLNINIGIFHLFEYSTDIVVQP